MTKQNKCCGECFRYENAVKQCLSKNCPCHKKEVTLEPVESWDTRFDTEFRHLKIHHPDVVCFRDALAFGAIKDFIRETLASQKQKQIEEFVDYIKTECPWFKECTDPECNSDGYYRVEKSDLDAIKKLKQTPRGVE